jgi:hypothetical protein
MRSRFRWIVSLMLALGVFLAMRTSADVAEDRRVYQERLQALLNAPPTDEYLEIWKSGGGLHRTILLWVKAGPTYQKGGRWARKLTIFVDDISGHRVRTVPNTVAVEVSPPAQLASFAPVRTSNGEATVEIIYGPGQQVVSALVKTVPLEAHRRIQLPLAEGKAGPPQRKPVDEAGISRRLEMARDALARGKRQYASRDHFAVASSYMKANEFQRAAQAFAHCETQFPDSRWAVLCAYGQLEALRRSGQTGPANQVSTRILKQYPDSIPAQFVAKTPGEIWFIPHF